MSLFDQTPPINKEDFDILKYMDLNNISNITYEELCKDCNNFKLSGTPLIDMICIKHLGNFIDTKFSNEKWLICPNIIDDIYNALIQKLPNCHIKYNDIARCINKLRKDNTDPYSIDVNIESYMTDYLRYVYWQNEAIKQTDENINMYFSSKKIVNNTMKEIKNKYVCEWNEINQKIENIQHILFIIFDEAENNPDYIMASCLLDKINNDACKYINPIRINIIEQLKSEYKNNIILNTVSEFNNLEKVYNKLKKEFLQEIEKVYEKVLIDNKIDSSIQKHILEFFVIEKSMHEFNLSLDLIQLILSQFK